jgi:hypothetical protein
MLSTDEALEDATAADDASAGFVEVMVVEDGSPLLLLFV